MLKHYFIGISLTILVLSFHTARANRTRVRQNNTNTNGEFDRFALTQVWPQASCWDINYKQPGIVKNYTCYPCNNWPENNNWTLHGLWPNSKNGSHPEFCNKNISFDLNLLSENLKEDLHKYWSTYQMSLTNRKFWKKQWLKHGTCALQVEHTNSHEKYFAKAVELLHLYNIGNILQEARVIPGKEYSLETINRAIYRALRVTFSVGCARLPDTGKQYLVQVFMCFDKNFTLIDCYQNNKSSCRQKDKIVYQNILRPCSVE